MPNSVYEMWLSKDKEKIRLPVLPESLEVETQSQNESIKISKLGEVTIIQDPNAKLFSFSTFFPKRYLPSAEYKALKDPKVLVQQIEKWMESGEPARFLVTGTKVNFPVSIESFKWREQGGEVGDIYFDISLKEYKFVTPKKIKVAKKKTTTKRPSTKKQPKTYVVKKGDTLWALAGKFYGNNTQWRKIWNANKKALIKRDRRNLKQPGHWIHIGFKLKIPA